LDGNKAEVINEFMCTSSKMKLQAVIGGDKIDDMDYRFLLFYKAIELGCEWFFSYIRYSEGPRCLVVRIKGDEDLVTDFKDFLEDHVHEGAQLSGIIFEEYAGHVLTIEIFFAFCTAELLDKWDREYKLAEKMNHNSNDIII
jgi:hypothetical protein